jgi:hypothetical protein
MMLPSHKVENRLRVYFAAKLDAGSMRMHLVSAGDLRFGIRERDLKHERKVSAPDYTRESAVKYIAREQREAVTDLLCQSLGVLTKHSGAKHLTMVTFYANLPDKALKKYKEVCNFLEGCGFELKEEFRDEDSGKNYWFLSLVEKGDSRRGAVTLG